MSIYDYLVKYLRENKYNFFTYFDNSLKVKEVVVETERYGIILNYRFDKYGLFEEMWYTHTPYDSLIKTMLWCNLTTNQFSTIKSYYGGKKAKIREDEA